MRSLFGSESKADIIDIERGMYFWDSFRIKFSADSCKTPQSHISPSILTCEPGFFDCSFKKISKMIQQGYNFLDIFYGF